MYQRIMVPLDGSRLAECVLPHVEAIAKGAGAKEVIFVCVAEQFPTTTGGELTFSEEYIRRWEAESKNVAKKYLQQLISKLSYPGVSLKAEVLTGKPADALADYATKSNIDLIIIATHGRSGVSRWVYGSVAARILRSAGVPVLMVRAPGCVPGI